MTGGGVPENIRQAIRNLVGVPVEIRVGLGRLGAPVCVGRVDATYANVFTVCTKERPDKLCFSYHDVGTRGVSLIPLGEAARGDAKARRRDGAAALHV